MLTLDNIRSLYRDHQPDAIGRHRFYSVLVPFVEKDGQLHILYELRAYDLDADPGEICFPGGAIEKGEDACEAALREMAEETGIPADQVELVGEGNTLFGFANYTIYSHIGIVSYEAYENAQPQESEVAELFLVPLTEIMEAEHHHFPSRVIAETPADFPYEHIGIDEDYNWRKGRWDVPVFDAAGRVIWGLTARITEDVMRTIQEELPKQDATKNTDKTGE